MFSLSAIVLEVNVSIAVNLFPSLLACLASLSVCLPPPGAVSLYSAPLVVFFFLSQFD